MRRFLPPVPSPFQQHSCCPSTPCLAADRRARVRTRARSFARTHAFPRRSVLPKPCHCNAVVRVLSSCCSRLLAHYTYPSWVPRFFRCFAGSFSSSGSCRVVISSRITCSFLRHAARAAGWYAGGGWTGCGVILALRHYNYHHTIVLALLPAQQNYLLLHHCLPHMTWHCLAFHLKNTRHCWRMAVGICCSLFSAFNPASLGSCSCLLLGRLSSPARLTCCIPACVW